MTICREYLDDEMLCEEVRSEAFLKILLNINKADIPNERALMSWMKKITINEALHVIRRKKGIKIDKDLSTCDEESITIMDPDLDYSEIVRLIMSLPETYRTVLHLHVIDGYSHNEIAEKLGITILASRSQLYHARLTLRNIVNKKEKNQ
jgi:RNA polymerase sigma-70 factor (ECF subfamily)